MYETNFNFSGFIFLNEGLLCINAQDLIVLKDGNVIEAKVMEIYPSEIRYKRFDNLDGPMIIIPSANVLSIRYENGTTEVINSVPEVHEKVKSPSMDPDKLYFSISADPSGFLLYGPLILTEFTKNHFNAQVYVSFPSVGLVTKADGFGIGTGVGFNYLWHSRLGAFYLGGIFEYNTYPISTTTTTTTTLYYNPVDDTYYSNPDFTGYKSHQNTRTLQEQEQEHLSMFSINVGYKFILLSGIYFRTGAYLGVKWSYVGYSDTEFSIKPDLTFGYSL
jgi:hypothetical protein